MRLDAERLRQRQTPDCAGLVIYQKGLLARGEPNGGLVAALVDLSTPCQFRMKRHRYKNRGTSRLPVPLLRIIRLTSRATALHGCVIDRGPIRGRERLGGMLNYYFRQAA